MYFVTNILTSHNPIYFIKTTFHAVNPIKEFKYVKICTAHMLIKYYGMLNMTEYLIMWAANNLIN